MCICRQVAEEDESPDAGWTERRETVEQEQLLVNHTRLNATVSFNDPPNPNQPITGVLIPDGFPRSPDDSCVQLPLRTHPTTASETLRCKPDHRKNRVDTVFSLRISF